MYCWSCGIQLETPGRPCHRCGAEPPDPLPPGEGRTEGRSPALSGERSTGLLQLRGCPACGFRGEGIPYFRRAGNMALLAAATLFTYGVGGVVYWLLKRSDRVCPSCGLGWDRSRPLGEELRGGVESGGPKQGPRPSGAPSSLPTDSGSPSPTGSLPGSGIGRRVLGIVTALVALVLVGIGIAELSPVLLVVGGVTGLTGALTYGWGWKALERRREVILQGMQRRVLHLARARGGRLTATDVATDLDLSLNAAERVLLSLDDGFRIRSDVTDEGILLFEFPELLLGRGERDEPSSGGGTRGWSGG